MCVCVRMGQGEENAGKGAGLELGDLCGALRICDPIIVGPACVLYIVKCFVRLRRCFCLSLFFSSATPLGTGTVQVT